MTPSSFFQYFRFGSDKRVDILYRVHWIENIQKGIHILPKIRRFISVIFNVRSAKKLSSRLLRKK